MVERVGSLAAGRGVGVNAPAEVADRALAAFNSHDQAALRACYDEAAKTRRPGWPQEAGVEELLLSIAMDIAAIPDLHLEVVSRTVGSDSVGDGGVADRDQHRASGLGRYGQGPSRN